MAEIKIRGLSEDAHVLLQNQAKSKGISLNTYAKLILEHSAIAGMPDITAILPSTIEYTIRSVIRSDNERLMAYTDAQARILQDAVRVLRQFVPGDTIDASPMAMAVAKEEEKES